MFPVLDQLFTYTCEVVEANVLQFRLQIAIIADYILGPPEFLEIPCFLIPFWLAVEREAVFARET